MGDTLWHCPCSCTGLIPFQANWALLYAAVSQQTTTPPTPSSSLAVQVFSAPNSPATSVPGVVYGVLYNSSGFSEAAFMNSSGYLNFYGVSPGTYTLEVYHYPNTGLNLIEYWGGMTVNLQPGSNFVTFYRHEPWIYNLQASASNGSIVVTVTVNGTVTSPTQGEIELWVTNNPSLASPYSPSKVINVTINPGLNTFNLTYPVSQAGTYYVYAALLTYNNTYTVTDQWNWTLIISPKGSLTFYVPVWYNGTTYYVYWSVKGISVTSTEGNVISSTIGVSPNQFLQLFLQLNSSHAIMKFEGITYQNGTPITNTAQEELILGYLYLWLLLGSNWKTVAQNYGTTSTGYQFLSITVQSGIPTVIETANGITNAMYYLLDVLDVIEGFIEGNNQGNHPISTSTLDKATYEFFKVFKFISLHELQDEFGNQKAQEIEELFKQYHLQASNYIELLQEFSSLPPSEQENFIASLYEITTGQTLPNPALKAAYILIIRIIKGVPIIAESFADSLSKSLADQGVDQYFASLVSQNFESDLQNEISDSILSSSEGLTSFLLLTVADIIENAWNIPNEIVYSMILALINNLNYNYEYLENYINAYETSSVANLTLASQLYSAMILNNLWWSEMWHNFYSLPWPHPNNDYLIYSHMDYNNAIDTVLTLSNLMVDASFTLKWGYIPPIFILDQNIYTPIVPQYSSFWNSFLEHLISLKEFTINGILTVIKIFGDPPLAIINVNSTFILLNGTKIYTNNPFAFTSYQNNSYLVVLPISNITYLGIESNETTHAAITPLTNKTTIFNVTLSPYDADVLKVVGSNVSIINTTISINTPGMVSLTGKNNLSFVWLSNGNLVIRGLPPGQYVVQNPVTNTTIQQINVSSQNNTETTQTPVSPTTTTTSSASTSTSISTGTITTATTTTSSSTSSVTTPTTSSMTNSVKPTPSATPTWVVAAVVVIVLVVLIVALLMSRRGSR